MAINDAQRDPLKAVYGLVKLSALVDEDDPDKHLVDADIRTRLHQIERVSELSNAATHLNVHQFPDLAAYALQTAIHLADTQTPDLTPLGVAGK